MIYLTIINIVLLALLGWERYQSSKERAKFINALKAKNAFEQKQLDDSDRGRVEVNQQQEEDPYQEVSQMNNQQFADMIEQQLEQYQ